jgi:NADPH:quinone reductase-like Zn-dependent oxidoreductase
MQAIRYERYGGPDVLSLEEVDRPEPADDEVLVRVHAASANPYDYHFMRGTPHLVRLISGLRRPKPGRRTLGVDFAGTVEATGAAVTRFRAGDEVFGLNAGAFAEYVCAPEAQLAAKPPGVSHAAVAAVPVAGLTALQGLRDHGQIAAGQRVLVNGAAGGVGTFAVQIARSFGAEVTGVCSTRNLELVDSIGAEQVVDYTREDFATLERRYDLVFDAVGNRSLGDLRRVLAPGGRFVAAAGPVRRGLWLKVAGRGRMVSFTARRDATDLAALAELLADGEVTPVIDRCYPLGEVAEAIRYLEAGHARGKVVISV